MEAELLVWLITGGILAVGVVLGAILVYLDAREQRSLIQRMAEQSGAVVSGGAVLGRTAGRDYRGQLLRRTKGASVFKLSVSAHVPFDLVVTRRERTDSLMASTGLLKPSRSGDETFDKNFKVLAKEQSSPEVLLDSGEWRSDIQALFRHGVQQLEYLGAEQKLVAVWDPSDELIEKDPINLTPIAAHLISLGSHGEPIPLEETAMDHGTDDRGFSALYVAYAAMLAFGGFAAMVGEVKFEPLDHDPLINFTVGLTLLAWVPLNFLSFRVNRRHIRGYQHFLGLLFMSAVCLPFASYALLVISNGTVGDQVADVQQLMVTESYREADDGTFHYFIVTESADAELPNTRRIDRGLYPNIVPGESVVEITTYPGWLGVPWSTPDDIKLISP